MLERKQGKREIERYYIHADAGIQTEYEEDRGVGDGVGVALAKGLE